MSPTKLAAIALALGGLSLGAMAIENQSQPDPFISFELFNSKSPLKHEVIDCDNPPATGDELSVFLKAQCHNQLSHSELRSLLAGLRSDFASTRDDIGLCILGRYFTGQKQTAIGVQLFEAAARIGNLNAMYFLGVAYQEGNGVNVSLVKSYVYLFLSTMRGLNTKDTKSRMLYLEKSMSSDQQEVAANQLGSLYWNLRQIDSMRYPSRFSAGIQVPDYLDAFCFLPKELSNEK
ncbi:hypothetical protein [Shewanella colwelliana]|uniref:hypothetical protein n=1 Tax=Shewanella colwelliana TaxID=23 RepID=UPI0022AFEBC7|nr:hypothetical protein [Shewanella colwelliana]MCZ4337701.1 hypothetical protein [Shewanella colwelliana]